MSNLGEFGDARFLTYKKHLIIPFYKAIVRLTYSTVFKRIRTWEPMQGIGLRRTYAGRAKSVRSAYAGRAQGARRAYAGRMQGVRRVYTGRTMYHLPACLGAMLAHHCNNLAGFGVAKLQHWIAFEIGIVLTFARICWQCKRGRTSKHTRSSMQKRSCARTRTRTHAHRKQNRTL